MMCVRMIMVIIFGSKYEVVCGMEIKIQDIKNYKNVRIYTSRFVQRNNYEIRLILQENIIRIYL